MKKIISGNNRIINNVVVTQYLPGLTTSQNRTFTFGTVY